SIVVGILLAIFLPKQYRSSATLGITAPIVAPNLVGQSVPFDNQERLRAITQQLMSVPIMARVVREEKLGSGTLTEPQLRLLRRRITIAVPDPVANTTEPRHLDTFVVSYDDSEAARAQQVANRLVSVFVDENSKERAQRAEDTSVFIGAQLRASQARL